MHLLLRRTRAHTASRLPRVRSRPPGSASQPELIFPAADKAGISPIKGEPVPIEIADATAISVLQRFHLLQE